MISGIRKTEKIKVVTECDTFVTWFCHAELIL